MLSSVPRYSSLRPPPLERNRSGKPCDVRRHVLAHTHTHTQAHKHEEKKSSLLNFVGVQAAKFWSTPQ